MITKIMVAEDNTSAFSCYQNYFSKDKTIEFIGHAQDGETAVKMYKEKNPDILFLDLKLPKKNGIEILNDLTEHETGNHKCNVVVVTGDNELRYSLCNTRKVYKIISKPISYTALEETIKDFKEEQSENEFSITDCQNLLMRLNLNPYSRSGRLLVDTIKLCYCNLDLLDNVNKVYMILAYRNSCSHQKIKSSLRSIVNTANRFSNNTLLKEIFYLENNTINISPKHFINGIVIYLKNKTHT